MCLGSPPVSMEKQRKRVGPRSGVGVPQLAPIAQCSTFLPLYKQERKERSSLPSVVAHTCNPSRSLGGQEHHCNCKSEVRWSLPVSTVMSRLARATQADPVSNKIKNKIWLPSPS